MIILDDGFQHRKLKRDLDIVLVDSEKTFGNENLLPAGPLREGLEAFDRLDRLVVVSKNKSDYQGHKKAEKFARVMGKKLKKQTLVCYSEPDFAYCIHNPQRQLELGDSVVAFSAIGQPDQFYNFLTNYIVQETFDFDDHHIYTQKDADKLLKKCHELDVQSIITTEKDASKLMELDFSDINIFALKLSTKIDVEALIHGKQD